MKYLIFPNVLKVSPQRLVLLNMESTTSSRNDRMRPSSLRRNDVMVAQGVKLIWVHTLSIISVLQGQAKHCWGRITFAISRCHYPCEADYIIPSNVLGNKRTESVSITKWLAYVTHILYTFKALFKSLHLTIFRFLLDGQSSPFRNTR